LIEELDKTEVFYFIFYDVWMKKIGAKRLYETEYTFQIQNYPAQKKKGRTQSPNTRFSRPTHEVSHCSLPLPLLAMWPPAYSPAAVRRGGVLA
jgi:hypothetical protein